jgi:DNA repair exonuclease SbcCD ATPase subunit
MRFVTFKSLKGKNFLSFGDVPIQVELKSGVNTIVGTNLDKEDCKNGAGKSSITEMLYYSLYGTTLREISKDHVQNTITNKRCEVSLEFELTSNGNTELYKIVRKLNPTKCQLFKNGEEVTRSTLAKTNEFIQQIIHTPATVFQNSVIMTVNNAVPFMALPKTDRRKFIESVLGLEVFTTMVLKVRDEYNTAKKDYEIAYTKLEQYQTELDFNTNQLQNYEASKQERKDKLTSKLISLDGELEAQQKNIIELPSTLIGELNKGLEKIKQNIDILKEKKNTAAHIVTKLTAEINTEEKQIVKLQTNKDTCPTCSRDFSTEHVEHVKQLIQEHQNNIEGLKKNIESANLTIKAIEEKIVSQRENKQLLESKKEDTENNLSKNKVALLCIKHTQENINQTKDELCLLEKEHNNDLKSKVKTLQEAESSSREKVAALNNELNILESVKFVISEEGIKSFIVKKILRILNSRLAYYLKKLEANCLCKFNEFFDEEILDEYSQNKSYFNFSGGERKRIDLACLFAFADIRRLQGDVNFSTVFYDELLDSSLDDKGVLLTLSVLRERFQENNESCYIITHRGNHVVTKAEHTIHVVKKNGVSSILS